MGFDHVTFYHTVPELDQRLRAAHEERAAAFHAAGTAVGRALAAAVRRLAGSLGRARRARRSYRELNALSDRQLADIGLHRAALEGVAAAAAAAPAGRGVTVDELRRSGVLDAAGRDRRVAPLPGEDRRQRRPAAWAAKRRVGAAAEPGRTAA